MIRCIALGLAMLTQPAFACIVVEPLTGARPIASGAEISKAPRISVDDHVSIALHPLAAARLAVKPGKAAGSGTFAGLVAIVVKGRGTLHVQLSDRAYVDLVKGSTVIASTSHAHRPLCSSMAKQVSFRVAAGTHLVQITGAPKASVALWTKLSGRP